MKHYTFGNIETVLKNCTTLCRWCDRWDLGCFKLRLSGRLCALHLFLRTTTPSQKNVGSESKHLLTTIGQ